MLLTSSSTSSSTPPLLPLYDAAANLPPATRAAQLPLPTLSVNDSGRVYMQYAFVDVLHLHTGQPIDLVPPNPGSEYWHLDVRATAAGRVKWYRDQRPRFHTKALPAGLLQPDQLYSLCLLPGEPQTPGFLPMLPPASLTNAFIAFLQAQALAARTR